MKFAQLYHRITTKKNRIYFVPVILFFIVLELVILSWFVLPQQTQVKQYAASSCTAGGCNNQACTSGWCLQPVTSTPTCTGGVKNYDVYQCQAGIFKFVYKQTGSLGGCSDTCTGGNPGTYMGDGQISCGANNGHTFCYKSPANTSYTCSGSGGVCGSYNNSPNQGDTYVCCDNSSKPSNSPSSNPSNAPSSTPVGNLSVSPTTLDQTSCPTGKPCTVTLKFSSTGQTSNWSETSSGNITGTTVSPATGTLNTGATANISITIPANACPATGGQNSSETFSFSDTTKNSTSVKFTCTAASSANGDTVSTGNNKCNGTGKGTTCSVDLTAGANNQNTINWSLPNPIPDPLITNPSASSGALAKGQTSTISFTVDCSTPTSKPQLSISLSNGLAAKTVALDCSPNASTPPLPATIQVTFFLGGLSANPVDTSRNFSLLFFPSPRNGAKPVSVPGTGVYDQTSGSFKANITLNHVPPGQYQILIHLDGALDGQLLQTDGTSMFVIQPSMQAKPISLILGDVGPGTMGDNFIDIIDYNKLAGCFGKPATGTCKIADLNDDGKIDQADIDLLISHFGSLGFSFDTPEFTCTIDPSCQSGQNTLQLCTLVCSKQPSNF